MTVSDQKIRKTVYAAALAALVCVATLVVQVPSPTGGYVNVGDGFVLLSGWLLGPWYGAAAAGLGTALTDLIMGYAVYAPASFIIKGLTALLAAIVAGKTAHSKAGLLLGGVLGEAWMALGYFLFTALLLGRGSGALLSVPGNLVQGLVGVVLGYLLMRMIQKSHVLDGKIDG